MRLSDVRQILAALSVAHTNQEHELGTRPNMCTTCAAVGSLTRHSEREGE